MEKEEIFKSGFVSMLGRTNVGKSSIMNAIVGEKVAAVANKSQTTRTQIKAIVNRPNSQIIFVDTPGIHKPKSKLGNVMLETAFGASTDVDIILFVVDASSNEIGKGDRIILDKIIASKKKCILVINKIDLVKKEQIASVINLYSKEYNFIAVVPVSVVKKKNLDELLNEIEKNLKEGPAQYEKTAC